MTARFRHFFGHTVAALGLMLIVRVAPAQLAGNGPVAGQAYSGSNGQTSVRAPRIEAGVAVDGSLDEPAWTRATILTGFSQYRPVDGRSADDTTQVLVWYSPAAIHFGIRAFEAHGTARATLADRDRIGNDDYIRILLDTFNDRRRATVLGVNPLGVQADGTLNEGDQSRRGGLGTVTAVRDTVDLSADFVYQSKGRLTPYGYEIEVRVPFKSIRYQADRVQSWGINVERKVQHSGYEDTWTPARQASASFLAQSGVLEGLTGLSSGLVLDLSPETTARVSGGPATTGWDYDASRPEIGGNVRWGVTSNLTLNGTVNPDFSQVEADVQQISFDPRAAVFFPETRPFFLEGGERFLTPNQLIYTRRVADPIAAVKLSGKLSGTDVGFLSAVDHQALSVTGVDHPIYNLLRLRRDLGGQSTAGLVYTDKIDGDTYNRVAGADARITMGKLYTLQFQGAGSFSRMGGVATRAPLWQLGFSRAGRTFGFSYDIQGIHGDFVAAGGFIRRPDQVNSNASARITRFGRPGATIESWTGEVRVSGNWYYQEFFDRQIPNDPKSFLTNSFTFKGGWRVGLTLLLESFNYDPRLFANHWIQRTLPGGVVDTIPYPRLGRIRNIGSTLDLVTPRFKRFSGRANIILSQDEDFVEWSPAFDVIGTITADWQPTDKLRVNLRYVRQQYIRRSDWTTVQNRQIPRLKIEYQLARPIFLRLVGQYDARFQDSLRDDTRTNFPVLLRDPVTGTFRRATRQVSNDFRVDWLFSYRPNPGTVFFLGYGSSLTETESFTFRDLHRVNDGFFVKASYLFRM